MRKLPSVSLDERPRSRRVRLLAFGILSLLVVFAPVIYESALLSMASWQGLFGVYPHVQTPVLDAMGDAYHMATFDFRQWAHGIFNRTPWKTSYVIPFAIFWTGVLALLLRKC
jgi:hypothetical protein